MDRLMSSGGIYGQINEQWGIYGQINLAVEGFMDRLMSSGGIYGQINEQWRDLWIDQ